VKNDVGVDAVSRSVYGKGIGCMATQNARVLIGRAVVSVADGEKLGAVSDVWLDLDERTVRGLVMGGGGGLFHQISSVIPLTQVRNIGLQAITVHDRTNIALMEGVPYEGASTLEMLRKRVITASGEVLGDGDDISFDETSGAFAALQLAPQGGFLGIGATVPVIPLDEVIAFGPDAITVADAAVAHVRPTG
jgi:uncharacterized protein YrrD